MIRNDRQLAIANRRRDEALRTAEQSDDFGNRVYTELANELRAEIDAYVAVRDGYHKVFKVDSIDDLAPALINARIARGWTQRQLAEAIGVSEQMVQRDEAGGYERASLARLGDIADVLDYRLQGRLRPLDEEPGGIVVTPQDTLGAIRVGTAVFAEWDTTESSTGTVAEPLRIER